MKATEQQVGGTHYTDLVVQPMPFCMGNDWDSCTYLIMKYTTRHNKPGGKKKQDIEKALHTVALREQLARPEIRPNVPLLERIPVEHYNNGNRLGELESAALYHLERWINSPGDKAALQAVKDCLTRLYNGYD